MVIEQTLHLLKIILKQNFFQYNDQVYQPKKRTTMGSPISSTMAEIYLKFLEETYIKRWLESKWIVYYKRNVDDILIIFDQNRTNEQIIMNHVNNIDWHLQFKISKEEDNITNYLDFSIHRNKNIVDIGIYRKLTCTDTTIQFSSNHQYERKLAAVK